MKYCVMDLEMAQPSGNIIQIGAVCYDTKKGVTATFNCTVNPHEQLSEFIIKLTGLTQDEVDSGYDLPEAHQLFVDWAKEVGCASNMATWGVDYWILKQQVGKAEWPWRRFLNVKEVATLLRSHDTGKARGGLSPSLAYFGLKFDGIPHNAQTDAYNTARLLQVIGLEHNLWIDSRRRNAQLDNI